MNYKNQWLLLLFMTFSLNLFAELSPSTYRNYQKNSPEELQILITDVTKTSSAFGKVHINAKAKVTRVIRSKTKLQRGDLIQIKYSRVTQRARGWVGPSPLPILKTDHSYRAFLKIGKNKKIYFPAARGKSFKDY